MWSTYFSILWWKVRHWWGYRKHTNWGHSQFQTLDQDIRSLLKRRQTTRSKKHKEQTKKSLILCFIESELQDSMYTVVGAWINKHRNGNTDYAITPWFDFKPHYSSIFKHSQFPQLKLFLPRFLPTMKPTIAIPIVDCEKKGSQPLVLQATDMEVLSSCPSNCCKVKLVWYVLTNP